MEMTVLTPAVLDTPLIVENVTRLPLHHCRFYNISPTLVDTRMREGETFEQAVLGGSSIGDTSYFWTRWEASVHDLHRRIAKQQIQSQTVQSGFRF